MIDFPERIRALERYSQRFEAFRLRADRCDVLFAMYPAGTTLEPHSHPTENWGVVTRGELFLEIGGDERRYVTGQWYHIPADAQHAARFLVDTEQIEFWFADEKPG